MLQRKRQPMSKFVKEALLKANVMEAYAHRPAYQQNDYLGWINRAVSRETKQKRLNQMVEELKLGGIYMGMKHAPSRK